MSADADDLFLGNKQINEEDERGNLDRQEIDQETASTKDSSSAAYIPSEAIVWFDTNKTIGKRVIQTGIDLYCPRDNSSCEIIISKISGPPLDDIKLEFELDMISSIRIDDCDSVLGRALEKVLLTVKKQEHAEIHLNVRRVEFQEDCGSLRTMNEDDNEMIGFILSLQLISFDSQQEIYELDDQTKLTRAIRHKERGVELYRAGKIYAAFYRFSKSLKLVLFSFESPSDDFVKQRQTVRLSCLLNIAACQLQTRRYEYVVDNCGKALVIDKDNIKAYYRRGLAYVSLQQYELARKDFLRAKDLNPGDLMIDKQLKLVNEGEKKVDELFAKRMSKMFKQNTKES